MNSFTKFISTIGAGAAVCATLIALSGCCKKQPPLVVATASDCVPFTMQQEQGQKLTGFDVDLMKALGKKLGRSVEFRIMPFDALLNCVQAKGCDMAIAAVTQTDEREKLAEFSDSYHETGVVLLMMSTAKVQALDDLTDKTVGVRAGTVQERLVKTDDRLTSIRNLYTRSFEQFSSDDIVRALASGDIIAAVVNADTANYILRQHPEMKVFPLEVGNIDMRIALPKGSEYKEALGKALASYKTSKDFIDLKAKWFSAAHIAAPAN